MIEDNGILLFIGILLILLSIRLYISSTKFFISAVSTTACVIAHGRVDTGLEGGIVPVIYLEYTVDDRTYRMHAKVWTHKPYEIGRTLEILYKKDDPSYASLNRVTEIYFSDTIALIVGVSMVIAHFLDG